MSITIGAKRRWAVAIIENNSWWSQTIYIPAGSGVWGEGTAFESPRPAQHWRDLVCRGASRSLLRALTRPPAPHRFSLQVDTMSVMHQPVENGVRSRRIANLRMPTGHRELTCE